jgi:hypothetical protein
LVGLPSIASFHDIDHYSAVSLFRKQTIACIAHDNQRSALSIEQDSQAN